MQSFRPRWASQLPGKLRSSVGRSISPCVRHPWPLGPLARGRLSTNNQVRHSSGTGPAAPSSGPGFTERAFQHRLQEVKDSYADPYPRLAQDDRSVSCSEFRDRYSHLDKDETAHDEMVVLQGRIRTHRLSGNKLVFFDLVQNGSKVQVMCSFKRLDEVTPAGFKKFSRLIRRGDAFSVTGRPHRTKTGELTVLAVELPQLISPCLHDVPLDAHEHEHSPYPRHVQLLADPKVADTLRARSLIIGHMRQFFASQSFMEVNTPIVGSIAGGAIARPFKTSATEFPDRELSLRIAPELWLKRLVVGGFDRVFEIGPSFRNEGLDKTHNPEFTTCEFYHAYATLEDLISTTEKLLSSMSDAIHQFNSSDGNLQPTQVNFTAPFRRIDFITGIEEATGRKLPDLTSPEANPLDQIKQLFNDLSLPLPEHPTLPRLLDDLSSTYLEPTCTDPTFITNPPECLSPLSKSFTHASTKQRVAARAELFIDGAEVVNMYEEENSPFEQRRKFEDQLRYSRGVAGEESSGEIDEKYLQAMEWGLPPTGGWGCGIDRLCMLFTGAKRIEKVLTFGGLRSVTRR